jgi:hypothetical protein
MIGASIIAIARAVPIINEIHRRGLVLRRVGAELVGGCPVCGDGGKGHCSNRFSVHARKGVWLCRQCRAGGDVIDLVQHLDGVDFTGAVGILVGERSAPAPQRSTPPSTAAAHVDDGHRRALDLWGQAIPIVGTLAQRYLIETRRLVLPPDVSPRVLRFHPRCPFGPDVHPCMVALYSDVVTDVPRAIMRTALTPDAQKIDRKALGPVGGAAIKLSDVAAVTMALTVGEGMETTLAGLMKGFAPAWTLGSAGAIAKFPVLPGVEALTILGETGDGGANERAVRECFVRWKDRGREVYRATSLVGGDFNDALMADT